jgi:hypothetical protein
MTSTGTYNFHVVRNGRTEIHTVDAPSVRAAVRILRGGFYDDVTIVGWGA